MKKRKFLLSVIPLCLLISACGINNYQPNKNSSFFEETDSNDNDFLDAKIKCLDPVVTGTGPVIGVQRVSNSDTVSVRFVGLIKLTDKNSDGKIDDDDLTNSTVTWTRTTYNADGSVKKSSGNKNATKVYDAISADGSSYSIETYNSTHSTSYTHFVTYAIRNIPSDAYKGNILVKLNVNGTTSKLICSSGDGYTQFTFDESQTGYFCIKRNANGTFTTISPVSYHTENNPYLARFEGLEKSTSSDKSAYIVVEKNGSTFKTYGYSDLANTFAYNTSTQYSRSGDGEFFQSKQVKNNGDNKGAFVALRQESNQKYLIIKSVTIRYIGFKTMQSPQKFSQEYISSYRLALQLNVTEKVRNSNKQFTYYYEEGDMEVKSVTISGGTYQVLVAKVYTSYAGSNDDNVTDNLKWWSIRNQYTGYTGWPNDTYYGNGNIQSAGTSTSTKYCYVCTATGSNIDVPKPGSCTWNSGTISN